MKILIIILCIALLFRNPKEGFWNKVKKAAKSVSKSVSKAPNFLSNIVKVIVDPMIAIRAAQELFRRQQECIKNQINFNNVSRERSQWRQKVNDLKNRPKYRDPNFNQDFYDFYRNDLTALNNNINENTKLNNELNGMLKLIKILQINNKRLIDLLKTENTNLKECKINKELTDNDYDVLT